MQLDSIWENDWNVLDFVVPLLIKGSHLSPKLLTLVLLTFESHKGSGMKVVMQTLLIFALYRAQTVLAIKGAMFPRIQ